MAPVVFSHSSEVMTHLLGNAPWDETARLWGAMTYGANGMAFLLALLCYSPGGGAGVGRFGGWQQARAGVGEGSWRLTGLGCCLAGLTCTTRACASDLAAYTFLGPRQCGPQHARDLPFFFPDD